MSGQTTDKVLWLSHRFDGFDYSIHFDRVYSELLTENSGLRPGFVAVLEEHFTGPEKGLYRFSVTYHSVPLLIQVDGPRRRIGVYSYRAATELFLKEVDDDPDYEEHLSGLAEPEALDAPLDIDFITRRHRLADFNSAEYQAVYNLTLQHEDEITELIDRYRPSLLERLSDLSLNLTADYVMVRNHLLKFLAILPSLDHDRKGGEVKRILVETIRRLKQENDELKRRSSAQKWGGKAGQRRVPAGSGGDAEEQRPLPALYLMPIRWAVFGIRLMPSRLAAWMVRQAVRFMARRFIAGESMASARGSLKALRKSGREATLDQLGELVVAEEEADRYKEQVVSIIRGFAQFIPKGSKNPAGINNAHISIKVSALASHFVPEAFDYTYKLVAPRLREILITAKAEEVFVNIDAEHYASRDLVFQIYRKVLLETEELKDYASTGIVIQAYLRDAFEHLCDVVHLAEERGLNMPVRLVKGAYWDAETVAGLAHAYKAPQFLNKEETDIHYRQLVRYIFEMHPRLTLCLASHNLFDHAFAQALRKSAFPNLPQIEHQCLHMTYEGLSTALARWGVPVRNYVPVGSLLVGMAYFVRRIMENSSQVGFLTQMRNRGIEKVYTPAQLLQQRRLEGRLAHDITREPQYAFENVSQVHLYDGKSRRALFQALEDFRSQSARRNYANRWPVDGDSQEIYSPSEPSFLVGRITFVHKATAHEQVDKAVTHLGTASNTAQWNGLPVHKRAAVLARAARLLTIRRMEIAALIVFEAAKSLPEAVADVDEAVDFLNYYAREEVRLKARIPDAASRGVFAIISPWNFPIAIPAGMAGAALAAGNSVILKSAEQSPLVAQVLVNTLHEAGVPSDCLIHLPGEGEVGAALVEHPGISGIAFTGSKAVGTSIAKTAGRRRANDGRPVRVITEMGGKNAIIVTSSAELDEAISGILYSAFAHGGQKCSACSRVLVDASVKNHFVTRFAKAARDMQVGEAWHGSTYMNPVITEADRDRLRAQATGAAREARAASRGEVHLDRTAEELPGFGVGPMVVELPAERLNDPQSYCRRELFGPIVHVIPYQGLTQAVKLFNQVEYGLTGGVFCQSQDDIDALLGELEAGNLYVNRSCTGARVAIEPFGGFKLSGTGPKAGCRHYLDAFHGFDRMCLPHGTIPYGHNEKVPEHHPRAEQLRRLLGLPTAEVAARVRFRDPAFVESLWHEFLNWTVRNYEGLLQNGEPNRRIPGQISRDDLSLRPERALFVFAAAEVDYASWVNLAAALLHGLEVGFCFAGEAGAGGGQAPEELWRSLCSRLKAMGFDTVWHEAGKEQVTAAIGSSQVFILDLPEKENSRWFGLIYDSPGFGTISQPWIPHIFTPLDGPHVRDYVALYRTVSQPRSFAVNTMRHGAPLE